MHNYYMKNKPTLAKPKGCKAFTQAQKRCKKPNIDPKEEELCKVDRTRDKNT